MKYEKSPSDVVNTLLSTYVLSGCDSNSYPYRRGKRTAALVALNLIGQLPNISSSHVFEVLELIMSFNLLDHMTIFDTFSEIKQFYVQSDGGHLGFCSLKN